MERWKKVVAGLLIVLVGVPLLLVGTAYATAWCQRWRAGKLLAVLKTVRPGVTTQDEYLKLVQPFEGLDGATSEDGRAIVGSVGVFNHSPHLGIVFGTRVGSLYRVAYRHIIPPPTGFFVVPRFEAGFVSELHIEEYMAHAPGHPPGAFVNWTATRYEGRDAGFFDHFSGYWTSEMGIQDQAPWEFHVRLDERASPEELRRALDFQFHCFTSIRGCEDAHQYFHPAPAPKIADEDQ